MPSWWRCVVGLESVMQLEGTPVNLPVVICTDSRVALATLEDGARAQTTALGTGVWLLLVTVAETGRHVYLQWVPAHCRQTGNERTDMLAKEASACHRKTCPWTFAPSPMLPTAPHPRRSGVVAGLTASSGGLWGTRRRSRSS